MAPVYFAYKKYSIATILIIKYNKNIGNNLEARDGIEPTIRVLQTRALPLCYRANDTIVL